MPTSILYHGFDIYGYQHVRTSYQYFIFIWLVLGIVVLIVSPLESLRKALGFGNFAPCL